MNGILIINKPKGLSSSDACLQVKKRLGLKKVGHLGTLDPLATGVLPLCVNEGTKLAPFLLKTEKEYTGTMQLGVETDTHDSEGAVTRISPDIPTDTQSIKDVFQEFAGDILQTPPMYSALKQNGIPLYRIARRGGWVPREQRKVFIRDIEVLSINLPFVVFRVVCSHGTYIRVLCHDIGRRLSCGAHVTRLERIRNGSFHIHDSITLEDCTIRSREELMHKHLITTKDALEGLEEVAVGEDLEEKIRRGGCITAADISGLELPHLRTGQQFKVISLQAGLVCIAESLVGSSIPQAGGMLRVWKILRVFLH